MSLYNSPIITPKTLFYITLITPKTPLNINPQRGKEKMSQGTTQAPMPLRGSSCSGPSASRLRTICPAASYSVHRREDPRVGSGLGFRVYGLGFRV